MWCRRGAYPAEPAFASALKVLSSFGMIWTELYGLLQAGKPVAASIAPSFAAIFSEIRTEKAGVWLAQTWV